MGEREDPIDPKINLAVLPSDTQGNEELMSNHKDIPLPSHEHNEITEISKSEDHQNGAEKGSIKLKPFQKIIVGLFISFFIISNSISQGEYSQYAYKSINFANYWFLNYFIGCYMIFSFPLYYCLEFLFLYIFGLIKSRGKLNLKSFSATNYRRVKSKFRDSPLSWKRFLLLIFPLGLCSFGSGWLWFISLNLMPVSLNTTLFQSIVIFVFILSVVFLKEKASLLKILAIIIALSGILLIMFGATKDSASSSRDFTSTSVIIGSFLVLLSSFLYACYEIIFVKFIASVHPAMEIHQVLAFQSFIGIYIVAFLWPGIPLEILLFDLPSVFEFDEDVWMFLLIDGVLAFTYYIAYTLGIVVTSPLYITMSTLLAIPTAGVIDHFLYGDTYGIWSLCGAILIVSGIILINVQQILFTLRSLKSGNPK